MFQPVLKEYINKAKIAEGGKKLRFVFIFVFYLYVCNNSNTFNN